MFRLCEVEGCTRKHYGNGMCRVHYRRNLRGRPMEYRTLLDRNEIFLITEEICIMYVYDKMGNYKACTIFDKEDYLLVKDHKWKISRGYIVNNKVGHYIDL